MVKSSILNLSNYNIVIMVHRKNDLRDYWSFWGTDGVAADFVKQNPTCFKLYKAHINHYFKGTVTVDMVTLSGI